MSFLRSVLDRAPSGITFQQTAGPSFWAVWHTVHPLLAAVVRPRVQFYQNCNSHNQIHSAGASIPAMRQSQSRSKERHSEGNMGSQECLALMTPRAGSFRNARAMRSDAAGVPSQTLAIRNVANATPKRGLEPRLVRLSRLPVAAADAG